MEALISNKAKRLMLIDKRIKLIRYGRPTTEDLRKYVKLMGGGSVSKSSIEKDINTMREDFGCDIKTGYGRWAGFYYDEHSMTMTDVLRNELNHLTSKTDLYG